MRKKEKREKRRPSDDDIRRDLQDGGLVRTALDFESWYGEVEEALVDASHETYQ